jgi:hypothetical protein
MIRGGQPTRSFNLAYNSMRPPEDGYVLEQALAGRTAPLRYVLVEADEIGLEMRVDLEGTARMAYWHDPRRMLALTQEALGRKGEEEGWWSSWDERRTALREWASHVPPFLAWGTNLGRGESLLRPARGEWDWNEVVGRQRDGFTADTNETLSTSGARRLRQDLKERRKGGSAPEPASAAGQRRYADLERRIAAAGAQMIVIVTPRTETGRILPDPQRFPAVPVFDFSSPTQYPELFAPEHRRDADHLNLVGASIFTKLLATRLLEWTR